MMISSSAKLDSDQRYSAAISLPSFGSRISGQKARRAWVTSEAAAESVVSRPSQARIRSAAFRRRSSAPGVWSMA